MDVDKRKLKSNYETYLITNEKGFVYLKCFNTYETN